MLFVFCCFLFCYLILSCLASVYAALRNWPLALTYHGQQLALASHSRDKKMTALAHEMFGDTLCLKEDYE